MSKYKPYPKYKESGVAWLGEVPEGWEVIRNKYIYKELNERSKTGKEKLLSVSEYYGVKPRADAVGMDEHLSRADSLIDYKKCYKNNLVMNIMLAWKKGLGITEYDGIVSPAYCVFQSSHFVFPKYMHYLLRTSLYTSNFKSKSTGVIDSRLRLYPEMFGTVETLLPSLKEQIQIANYLDQKTKKINTLIEKKQTLIELLQEKRQALISHVVTKGLDDSVPMKESGVAWLGEVPEGWGVTPLRYLGLFQNGISKGKDYFGSGSPFVNYGDIYKNGALPSSVKGLAKSSKEDQHIYSVRKGDVFFTRTSETIHDIGMASTCLETIDKATFSGFTIRFRQLQNVLNENFSKYYFRTGHSQAFFEEQLNLVTRASLGQDILKQLPVLTPPLKEQTQIANYLDQKTKKIDTLIEKSKHSIELLKERRTALISAVVTGKVDVRD